MEGAEAGPQGDQLGAEGWQQEQPLRGGQPGRSLPASGRGRPVLPVSDYLG